MKPTSLYILPLNEITERWTNPSPLLFPRHPPSFCSYQQTPFPMSCFGLVREASFHVRLNSADGSNVSRDTAKPLLSSFSFAGAALCYGITRAFGLCSSVRLGMLSSAVILTLPQGEATSSSTWRVLPLPEGLGPCPHVSPCPH